MDWRNLDLLEPKDEAKFVIAGRADYEWSRDLVRERRLHERCAVLFSPVHGALEPGLLGGWILDDGLPCVSRSSSTSTCGRASRGGV
jgi:7-carboxy-7-deazaguanine synthase